MFQWVKKPWGWINSCNPCKDKSHILSLSREHKNHWIALWEIHASSMDNPFIKMNIPLCEIKFPIRVHLSPVFKTPYNISHVLGFHCQKYNNLESDHGTVNIHSCWKSSFVIIKLVPKFTMKKYSFVSSYFFVAMYCSICFWNPSE